MHSEAKQTEMLAFGAEKGLLLGLVKRQGDSCSKKNPVNPGRILTKHF